MIEEATLYANLYVETSPIQTTASWTNHIADVRDVSLTRGGIEDLVGVSSLAPGSGTITLVETSATILPGYWVRIRYSSSIIWAGYVQDVSVAYTFIDGVTYAVTTLTVLDWAAWIAQFSTSGLESAWYADIRRGQINTVADGTPVLLRPPVGIPPANYVFDELIGERTLAEILDISATTINGYWKPMLAVPTGSGAGINEIIDIYNSTSSSNIALTDGTHTGSPTNLMDYVDLEVATRTSQVSNSVTVNNHWGLNGDDTVVTYSASDSTSIATYGSRFASIETNTPVFNFLTSREVNLFPYPSFEDFDQEYTDSIGYYTAEQPALDAAGAWTAWNGDYAARGYVNTASPAIAVPPNQRVAVTAGTTYYGFGYGAASNGSSNRGRFYMVWYNEAGAQISVSYGSYVTFTSLKTWYKCSMSAAAPAGALYARVGIQHSRTTGANVAVGEKHWTDGIYFGTENAATWFSGDTADTSSKLYFWYGTPNASESSAVTNNLATIATSFLTANKTPYYSPFTVRVNAQANLTAAVLIDLYKSIYIWFDSHRWTSVVTGITHNININPDGTTRWMIDLNIRPSAYTI